MDKIEHPLAHALDEARHKAAKTKDPKIREAYLALVDHYRSQLQRLSPC